MDSIILQLAKEFNIREQQVRSTVQLIDEGSTIPFIARYRKEATGGLDDALLRDLSERLAYLRNLQARREEVARLIDEQGKLTAELSEKIKLADTMTELDDIYRPFRPKRRTRAMIAKEKGLEPLADIIWEQSLRYADMNELASPYINPELEVNTPEDAFKYALDILAERISDDADHRKFLREYTYNNGFILTKALKDEPSVFDMYSDYKEAVNKIVPHRVLAINRGENEKALSVKIEVDEEQTISKLCDRVILRESFSTPYLRQACEDSYKRLIAPSIERELRNQLTEKAEEQAIRIFGVNLGNLLLQPPVKGNVVMGMDPGYRTGNKIAVVDDTGKVLDTDVVYITLPHHNIEQGKAVLRRLIEKHHVEIIAIGNGTASRESEIVTAELIREMKGQVRYTVVNEAGASVYSASKLGTEEFPQYDSALRSAVSIARRLQDPLAELVKIDPKSIGVGQYQHDVNQKRLAEALQGVVEASVNSVGVDLNTASVSLLQYVSGITTAIAKNIVAWREENGRFLRRSQLLKVGKLGPKAYEQCAGFLRIPDGDNFLDNTAVHPESYDAALKLLQLLGYSMEELRHGGARDISDRLRNRNIKELAEELNIGVPTLQDIIKELQKPGRDPRDELPAPVLRTDVMDIKDLKPGMILAGTVRNVIDFGAFVDIGVHQDGLVHISQLADRYVNHPTDVVQVGDIVKVKVLDVDTVKKRISLTMKDV